MNYINYVCKNIYMEREAFDELCKNNKPVNITPYPGIFCIEFDNGEIVEINVEMDYNSPVMTYSSNFDKPVKATINIRDLINSLQSAPTNLINLFHENI